jgi:molybdopterin-guanine dinucleotide biosynthesis protein A
VTGAVAGIILAGGASTRMHLDKASLLVDGETLLARTTRIVASVVDHVVVVGPESRTRMLTNVEVVADTWPRLGPLGGLLTGLASIDEELAFVAACDMPLLQPMVIQCLVDLARSGDAEAIIPIVQAHPQTLHSVYRKSCEAALRLGIEQGDPSARSLRWAIDRLSVRWVDEKQLRGLDAELISFRNMNTEAEWREFLLNREGAALQSDAAIHRKA